MKKFTWPSIIVLALVVLALGIGGVAKCIFGNRYEAEIAAIKAKGEPVTPEELMGKPIPAGDNAALVYEQAFKAMDVPALDEHHKVLGNFKTATTDPAEWRKAAKALSKFEKTLDLADKAASMPRCRFDVDWSDLSRVDSFERMAGIRSLARLVRTSAVVNARYGRMTEAVEYVDTLFGMARSMEDYPLTIAQLVRIAVLKIAIEALDSSLKYGNITEDQAFKLFKAMEKIDISRGFKRAYQGERVYHIRFFGPEGFPRHAAPAGGISVKDSVSRGLASLYSHTILAGDMAVSLEILDRYADGTDLSYREAKSEGLFDEPEAPFYATMSKMGVGIPGEIIQYAAEEELAQTRVFFALQGYKARYGGYPATMKELKSKLGWKLPVDPFSEKDFIYKRQAKGFILYSVGPDMKDDGGRAIQGNLVELESKGDIVLKWDR